MKKFIIIPFIFTLISNLHCMETNSTNIFLAYQKELDRQTTEQFLTKIFNEAVYDIHQRNYEKAEHNFQFLINNTSTSNDLKKKSYPYLGYLRELRFNKIIESQETFNQKIISLEVLQYEMHNLPFEAKSKAYQCQQVSIEKIQNEIDGYRNKINDFEEILNFIEAVLNNRQNNNSIREYADYLTNFFQNNNMLFFEPDAIKKLIEQCYLIGVKYFTETGSDLAEKFFLVVSRNNLFISLKTKADLHLSTLYFYKIVTDNDLTLDETILLLINLRDRKVSKLSFINQEHCDSISYAHQQLLLKKINNRIMQLNDYKNSQSRMRLQQVMNS